jgi:hypothetical protein
VVQPEILQMLEHDPTVPVDDCLGQSGRAARVHDPERVVEWHPHELERVLGGREGHVPVTVIAKVREHDRALDGGQRRPQLGDQRHAVEALASVAVSVYRQQDLRLDLREPVDDRPGAEVGRAAGPDRAEGRGRQERRDRLGDVRQTTRDTVAPTDAHAAQAGPYAHRLRAQLRPGPAVERATLGREMHRRVVIGLSRKHMLGKGERDIGEPARTRHRGICERDGRIAVGDHSVPVPDPPPEARDVGDRPLPQRVVVGETELA